MEQRLYRSRSDRVIAGVCGGLGEYLRIDPVWVRLAFVLLLFAQGIGLIAYLALWLLVPETSQAGLSRREAVKENIQDIAQTAREFGQEVRRAVRREQRGAEANSAEEEAGEERRRRGALLLVGAVLVALGAIWLVENILWAKWFNLATLWPLALVSIGVAILLWRRG